MTISIEGVLKPISPLCVSCVLSSGARYDYEKRRVTSGKVGMPLTATVHKSIFLSGETTQDRIPYFPANDIRGRLRRFAARQCFEQLSLRGERINMNTYDGMNAGNFSGRPDSTQTTLDEVAEASSHVFMGLFGGGPRTLRSKLVTSDLDPIYSGTIALGSIPSQYEHLAFQGNPWEMTSVLSFIRRDDSTAFADLDSMLTHIDDAFNAINDRQDQLALARGKRTAAKKATETDPSAPVDTAALKKSDLANMAAIQYIRPGLPLYVRIGFSSDPTDAQVGLLLESASMLFNQNALGIRSAIGMGRFDGHLDLVVDGRNCGTVLSRAAAADVDRRPGFVLSQLADPYIDAKDEQLGRLTKADLERFFILGTPATKPPSKSEAA